MDTLFQKADTQHRAGNLAAAESLYAQLLRNQPDHAEALFRLGSLYVQQNRLEAALATLERAIDLAPDNAEAWNNKGILLKEMDRHTEAENCCRNAVALQPEHPEFLYNLGSVRQSQNFPAEALRCYEHALANAPDHVEARWNRTLLLLQTGDFEQGWSEHECRLPLGIVPPPLCTQPLWNGSSLNGKTILVFAEQGAGDTFQFIRCLPLLQAQGARVVLEVPETLRASLQGFDGCDHVITPDSRYDSERRQCDVHLALMSLPHRLQIRLETIPAEVPYLRPVGYKQSDWQRRLLEHTLKNHWKVGIVWAGNPAHKNDRNRSCRLSDLAPLADIPGVSFFSLQKGPAAKEAAEAPFPLINLSSALEDYSDTAAVIDCLDLVISVDTSVAHLAGAMGKPVWTLLPFAPDWRWMLERDDTPWYPSMRLFRQEQPKEWKSVLEKVAVNLCNEIGVRAWETGDVQAALTAFLQALQRDPENRDTVLNCADVFKAFGQHDDAHLLLTRFLSQHQNDTEILGRTMEYKDGKAKAA